MKNYFTKKIMKSAKFCNWLSWIYSFISKIRISGSNGNILILKGAFLKSTKIRIIGKNNRIIIHPENRLKKCTLHIAANNSIIEIGKHCILTNLELWIEDDGGMIQIGYRTTIEGGHIASTEGESIKIGEDCMFSHRIEIRNGDSHSIYNKITRERINFARPVSIGNHVWLGADAKVLKGTTIGHGVIVATGAIVTGTIHANTIVAGIPAKQIKENMHWERKR